MPETYFCAVWLELWGPNCIETKKFKHFTPLKSTWSLKKSISAQFRCFSKSSHSKRSCNYLWWIDTKSNLMTSFLLIQLIVYKSFLPEKYHWIKIHKINFSLSKNISQCTLDEKKMLLIFEVILCEGRAAIKRILFWNSKTVFQWKLPRSLVYCL